MTKVHNTLQIIHQSENLLVAETPPQLRTIKVRWDNDEELPAKDYTFYLSFPYMQFYLTESWVHLSFSKQPVLDIEKDEISFPFLPNVYIHSLGVCLEIDLIYMADNRRAHRKRSVRRPNERVMEKVVEEFWNSGFYVHSDWYGCWAVPDAIRKNNLTPGIPDEVLCGEAVEQFRAWEEGTRKEGVDFISNLDWPHTFKNLPDLLAFVGAGPDKTFADHLDKATDLRAVAIWSG